jgi:hypothetical protein
MTFCQTILFQTVFFLALKDPEGEHRFWRVSSQVSISLTFLLAAFSYKKKVSREAFLYLHFRFEHFCLRFLEQMGS